MKKILLTILFALLSTAGIANAQSPGVLPAWQGGTTVNFWQSGSIPVGAGYYLATSSGFTYSTTSQRLTVTNASTTNFSATTICLTGDTCRTTWPSGSIGSSYPFTTTTNFGVTNSATGTPIWAQGGINASSSIRTSAEFNSYVVNGTDYFSRFYRTGETQPRMAADGFGSFYFGGSGSAFPIHKLSKDSGTAAYANYTNTTGPASIFIIDSDTANSGGPNTESTITLRRKVSGGAEFMDVFNNGYTTNGDVLSGLLLQKTGSGSLRDFIIGFYGSADTDPGNQIKNAQIAFSISTSTVSGTARNYSNGLIGIQKRYANSVLDINNSTTTDPFMISDSTNPGTRTRVGLIFTTAQNLGIGTSSPYARLSVAGETVAQNFTATSTATNTLPTLLTINATTTNLFATTASTTQVYSSGGVAIGTTSIPLNGQLIIQKTDGSSALLLGRGTAGGVTLDINFSGGMPNFVSNNAGTINIGSSQVNDSNKSGKINFIHYSTNTEEPMCGLHGTQQNGVAILSLGGLSTGCNGPISTTFYNSTTSTSTLQLVTATLNNTGLSIGNIGPSEKLTVQGNGLFLGSVTSSAFTATSTTEASTFPLITNTGITSTRATTTNATTTNFATTNATTTNLFSGLGLSVATTTNPSRSIILQKEDGSDALELWRGVSNFSLSMAGGVPSFLANSSSFVFGQDLTNGTDKITRLRTWGYNTTLPECTITSDSRAASSITIFGGVSTGCFGTTEFRFANATSTGSTYQETTATLNNTGLAVGTLAPSARLTVGGDSLVTATSTAAVFTASASNSTSTLPLLTATRINIGSDYITDFTGSGLSVVNGALTATGGGSWSTTSADYWYSTQNAWSTTSSNYWKSVNDFWSTTSATYFLSQNQGVAFSTTSADAWDATKNRWSTTSTDYWESTQNRWSTTSDSFAFDTRLAATTTLNNITTLGGLSLPLSQTTGTLPVNRGGTGATSFDQGWIYGSGDGIPLAASTSPTVNYITATSTIGTSTFAGSLQVNGGTLSVDAPNNMVGVGTTTPVTALTVANNGARNQLTLVNTNGPTNQKMWSVGTSRGFLFINSMDDTYGTTTRLTLDQDGDIGIGSTTPDAVLSVVNSINTPINKNMLVVASTTSGTATTTHFQIAASGNVSIGTTTSNRAKLTLSNTSPIPTFIIDGGASGVPVFRGLRSPANGGTGQCLQFTIASNNPLFSLNSGCSESSSGTILNALVSHVASNNFLIGTTTSQGVPNGLEPFILKNTTGNIGLGGTTTPWATLSVNQTIYTAAGTPQLAVGSSSRTSLIVTQSGNTGVATSSPWRTFSVTGTMAASGLTASAGTPNSVCINAATKEITENAATTCVVSDEDQKTPLKPLDIDALEVVRKMSPSSFSYKDNVNRVRYGFGAQSLQKIDNHLGDAFDKEGIARSIDLPAILAVNTAAIQELDEKVNTLAPTIPGEQKESSTDTWQWIVIGMLVAWNITLTIKRK